MTTAVVSKSASVAASSFTEEDLDQRPTGPVESAAARHMGSMQDGSKLGKVNLNEVYINKGENVRGIASDAYSPESIGEMMAQIEAVGGLQQPITICSVIRSEDTEGKDKMLMIGFRRALALLALAEQDPKWALDVPAKLVRSDAVATDAATRMAQLIENVGRKNLNQMEIAATIKLVLEDKETDFTQKDVARMLGRSEANISQLFKLNRFPKMIQDLMTSGKLQFSHARELLDRVPETAWSNAATKATAMMLDDFTDWLDKEYPRSNEDADAGTTVNADGTTKTTSQKPAKMLRSSDVTTKYVPFLKQQIEKADGDSKQYSEKDLLSARLDTLNTVLLDQKTTLTKDIAPYLEELTQKEKLEEAQTEAKKAEEKFFKEKVKRVEQILDTPVDPANPNLPRPSLTSAYAQVGKEIVVLTAEQKTALGFPLPASPDEFIQKLSATYQTVLKDRAEQKKKRDEAKAKKEAEEKAAAAKAPATA